MLLSRFTNPRFVARTLLRSSTPRILTATTTPPPLPTATAALRHYRGDSGEATPRKAIRNDEISERETKLAESAEAKAEAIFAKHISLPSHPAKHVPGDSLDGISGADALDIRKKRLVYRAKQRGWLEVDLLLGTWASENVTNLTLEELDEFEAFVNMETIDIYNVITLRTDVPEEMKGGCDVVTRIQDWARKSPLGKAEPETYEKVKRDNNLI